MAIVEPFGEDRADTRSKLNTLAAKQDDPDRFQKVYDLLDNYTGDTETTLELEANADALARMKKDNG